MAVSLEWGLHRVDVELWDPKKIVLRFNIYELCLTIEESLSLLDCLHD